MNDLRVILPNLSPLGGMLLAVFIMSSIGLVVCGAAMIVQAIRDRMWWRNRDPWWVDPTSSGAPCSPCRSAVTHAAGTPHAHQSHHSNNAQHDATGTHVP